MSTHNIPLSIKKKIIALNYPKYNNVCSYGIFPRNNFEIAMGVRAIEVLLYIRKKPGA